MTDKPGEKRTEKSKMTRRDFMKKATYAGAALTVGSVARPVRAAEKRDYILIGRPNPSSGPLSAFGEPSPWVDERALAEINKDGGIFIKEAGKKLPVRIKLVDTESDPSKTGDVTSKLILQDNVDLMIVLHTPICCESGKRYVRAVSNPLHRLRCTRRVLAHGWTLQMELQLLFYSATDRGILYLDVG